MNKLTSLFVAFLVTLLCFATSCKKGGEGGSTDDPANPSAKYLTAAGFKGSVWNGKTANTYDAVLTVSTESKMVFTYYVVKTLSKNTDKDVVKQTVNISYTFNEVDGTFSGQGDDNNSYSGSLKSTSSLDFKMPAETVAMTKK